MQFYTTPFNPPLVSPSNEEETNLLRVELDDNLIYKQLLMTGVKIL
jgi:hypothetical protein